MKGGVEGKSLLIEGVQVPRGPMQQHGDEEISGRVPMSSSQFGRITGPSPCVRVLTVR